MLIWNEEWSCLRASAVVVVLLVTYRGIGADVFDRKRLDTSGFHLTYMHRVAQVFTNQKKLEQDVRALQSNLGMLMGVWEA